MHWHLLLGFMLLREPIIDSKPLLSDTTISFLQLFNFIIRIAVNTCNVYVEHADVNRDTRIDSVGSLESPV